MLEILIGISLLIFILGIVFIFVFKVETSILLLFAVGISIQYLWNIQISSLTGTDIVGITVPVLLMTGLLYSGKNFFTEINKDIIIQNYFILIILFLLTGVVLTGTFYTAHTFFEPIDRIGRWAKLLSGFIILLIVSSYFVDRYKINKLLNAMLLSLIVPGSFFIWELVNGNFGTNRETDIFEPTAAFYHPGVVSYALVFHFPICLFKLSMAESKKEKTFWTLIAVIFIIMIYFTYRRNVWLGLITQLFTFFFLFRTMKIKFLFSYFFVGFLLIISFTTIPYTFNDRLGDIAVFFNHLPSILETSQYDHLLSGRWGIFRTNLLYFSNQSIINMIGGNGIGATHYPPKLIGIDYGGHNIYLIALIDYGIICFSLLVLFFYNLYKKLHVLIKSKNKFIRNYSLSLISLLMSYLVMGFATHLFYMNEINWIFLGLTGSLIGILRSGGNEIMASEKLS